MIKRVFSRKTYNGYHLVSFTGEDPSPLGFFRKSGQKDEFGDMAVEDDRPQCPASNTGPTRFSPWDNWLYVPSDCQKCIWVYREPQSMDYDCLLKTRKKVSPACLIKGGE